MTPALRGRGEVFLEQTKSICPVCKSVLDAEVNARDGKVFLRKRCSDHGEFEALVSSDADLYLAQIRFNKPGSVPLEFQTEVRDGCPLDCGLCPDHKQHSCLAVIEVNTACNLDCPICFADSGHQPDGYQLDRDQVAFMLDRFVAAEGAPEVIQFSGGEPTIHPDIIEFVEMARARGIGTVMLNTNGLRLARDDAFMAEIARVRPHIYLQFDGFDVGTHLAIRGRDLRADKERALERCAAAGVTVTLVAAVERGVNEHEAGAIVRYGVRHPAVNSVVFQPVTHSGRHREFEPRDRVTNAEIAHLLSEQLPEWYRLSDFVPVPCCFPTCRSMSYGFVDGDTLVPFTRLVEVDDYLDYVSNRFLPAPEVRAALEKMFSASAVPGVERALLECDACATVFRDDPRHLARHVFVVVLQDFQDAYTLNVRQLMKCCVAELVPDGRIIPFCAYNSVGYREQVRAQLSGVAVAPLVPNAIPLAPLLVATDHGSRTSPQSASRHLWHRGARAEGPAGPRDRRNVGSRLVP